MNGLAFVNTNILVHTDDASNPAKRERAIALFAEHRIQGTAVVSLQVLQEYYAAATRKLGVSPHIAQRKVEILSRVRVVRFDTPDVIAAIEVHRLHHISFWDALIIHAARSAGATVLYTEDLHAGGTIGGVKIVNPFEASSAPPRLSGEKIL
jgi:predicted nucleic acid-binding protein